MALLACINQNFHLIKNNKNGSCCDANSTLGWIGAVAEKAGGATSPQILACQRTFFLSKIFFQKYQIWGSKNPPFLRN